VRDVGMDPKEIRPPKGGRYETVAEVRARTWHDLHGAVCNSTPLKSKRGAPDSVICERGASENVASSRFEERSLAALGMTMPT